MAFGVKIRVFRVRVFTLLKSNKKRIKALQSISYKLIPA